MEQKLFDVDVFSCFVNYFSTGNNKKFHQAINDVKENWLNMKSKFDTTICESKPMNPLIKTIFEILKKAKKNLKGTENVYREELVDFLDFIKKQPMDNCCLNLIRQIEYYWLEVEYIKDFYDGYTNGILCFLKRSIEPKGALYENLEVILRKNWYEAKVNDPLRFEKLQILYFAYLTFIKQMFFIEEQYVSLADFHFQQANMAQCNLYLLWLSGSLKTFQMRLKDLLPKIHKIINAFNDVSLSEESQKLFIEKFSNALEIHADVVKKIRLPFSLEQPERIEQKLDFNNSNVKTPIGAWSNGAKVSYAIQSECNGIFTQISDWSSPCLVQDKANPVLHLGKSTKNRLIYRVFNKPSPPELVAILRADDGATSFHDIQRDLFNAAGNFNEDIAMQEFEILLQNGGNIDGGIFENGASFLHAAAAAGNVELAKKLILNNNSFDINLQDDNGCTALHLAAKFGYSNFVKFLLAHQADVKIKTKESLTALEIAAMKAHFAVIAELLKNEANDLSLCDEENGFVPLHYAIFGGCLVVEDFLRNQKININAKSKAGLTALHLAIFNDDYSLLNLFLKQSQIDINAKTNSGHFTALHLAVLCKNFQMVQLLLKQEQINVNATAIGEVTALHLAIALKAENIAFELLKKEEINVNAEAVDGIRPLHLAAQTDQETLVFQIIKHKAEINAATHLGMAALHLAVKFSAANALKILLAEKADIELKTLTGLTALMLAITAQQIEPNILKQLLVDSMALEEAFKTQESTFIFLTTQNADLAVFKNFIKNNSSSAAYKDLQGNSLLHIAVKGENFEVMAYLIESKSVDINVQNRRGQSALHFAIKSGNIKIVDYILKQNANTEIEDHNSQTPIFYAVLADSLEILQKLYAHEANDSQTDQKGANILHYAASLSITEYLVKEKRLDPYERDLNGETLLFYAARKNRFEIVKYLIEVCEMNIRHRCHRNRTPLMAAASHDSLEVIKYFVESHAADINARDGKDKLTALHFACQFNFINTIVYLIEHGANVHAKDLYARTPILYAAEFSSTEVLKYLIEHGANIHDRNKYDITTLHYAALGGNLANVKFLVESQNMDALAVDRYGESAVFHATRLDKLDVIKYFLEVRKISPYLKTNSNRTLLHSAYYLRIAKYLIEVHDLDINALSKEHMTPLDAADHDTAVYLKSLGAF